MSILVNDVIGGVVSVLTALYPDVQVTDEEISPAPGERAFFVKLLEAGQRKHIGRRYIRTHSFDIHYFGPSNEDRHAVAEQLYLALEKIQAPEGSVRGTGMSHKIVDGVLQFYVSYNFRVIREENPVPLMQKLNSEVDVRNG